MRSDLKPGAAIRVERSAKGQGRCCPLWRRRGRSPDKKPRLCNLSAHQPLQAGEVHVHREEARVAGHAVHRPLIVPGVRDRRHKRLRGRGAPGAGAALAGGSLVRRVR